MTRTIVGEVLPHAVWVDDVYLDPAASQAVFNHSPDGFAWGYHGSGPAQLALAILLRVGVERATAVRIHQHFKREHIAPLPMNQGFVMTLDVEAWADACAREVR